MAQRQKIWLTKIARRPVLSPPRSPQQHLPPPRLGQQLLAPALVQELQLAVLRQLEQVEVMLEPFLQQHPAPRHRALQKVLPKTFKLEYLLQEFWECSPQCLRCKDRVADRVNGSLHKLKTSVI